VFSPIEIIGFNVSGEIYKSATVDVEQSPDDINDLTDNPALIIYKETTFLQTLFEGEKSLYYYKNKQGKEQYYIKKGNIYELLVYKKFVEYKGAKEISENKGFANQLMLYLLDYPTIKDRVRYLKYNKENLEKIFADYYNYTNPKTLYYKKRDKFQCEFGVIAGMSLSTINLLTTSELSINNMNCSMDFAGGIAFDLILPRTRSRSSICNELFYSSYDVKNKDDHTLTLGYSYIQLNNMFRYKLPMGKYFMFMNLGISNGYRLQARNNLSDNLKFDRKHEQGFLIGLGGRYQHCSLELRLEHSNGPSSSSQIKCNVTRYFVLFGYRF
jgi:hypothetical protein